MEKMYKSNIFALIEFLKSKHPYATQKRNKLGIFSSSYSSPISQIAKNTFSFALNVGPNIADKKLPGVKNIKEEIEKATKSFIKNTGYEPNDTDIAIDYNKGTFIKDIWDDIGIIRNSTKYKRRNCVGFCTWFKYSF